MPHFALVGFATAGDVEGRQPGLRYPVVALVDAVDLEGACTHAYSLLAEGGWDSFFVKRGKALDLDADYSEHSLADQIEEMLARGASIAIYDQPVLD